VCAAIVRSNVGGAPVCAARSPLCSARQGVTKAVKNIEEKIAPALKGMNPTDQESIDKKMIELDGTANKCGPPPSPARGAPPVRGVDCAQRRVS
jgi:cytochrome c556